VHPGGKVRRGPEDATSSEISSKVGRKRWRRPSPCKKSPVSYRVWHNRTSRVTSEVSGNKLLEKRKSRCTGSACRKIRGRREGDTGRVGKTMPGLQLGCAQPRKSSISGRKKGRSAAGKRRAEPVAYRREEYTVRWRRGKWGRHGKNAGLEGLEASSVESPISAEKSESPPEFSIQGTRGRRQKRI